jgi:EAL domain-containing protein (putative c-di-GMP-specific phosphodiesterase class I)
MKAADTACYIAKDMGRNRIHAYSEDDDETVSRRGEMDWVGRIHYALEHNRFCLFRQRIVHIADGGGHHYEILIRMLDEQGNLISPMAFIPAAERYNLMPAIDRWVVRTMLTRLSSGMVTGDDGAPHVWAINLSGASLNDGSFLKFIKEQFEQLKVPPKSICFEITETAAITNLTRAEHFISAMRKLGCQFSLDDFGSGMSSFGYLKYLPVDYLKIDGSFVKDMASDPIDAAMVESINKIGHLMGLKTIAEYVENQEIVGLLKQIGVDYAQGYGIHKPEPF